MYRLLLIPMTALQLSQEMLRIARTLQKEEITEHHIYTALSAAVKDPHNRDVLLRMAREEYEHYEIWKQYTQENIGPDQGKIRLYYILSRTFGLNFGIKLMERLESRSTETYAALIASFPESERMLAREKEHEEQIIALIDEEKLRYIGSIVLGLNDALVEFTGTLAGLTFALQDSRLIALIGLIMGVAASLSMAAAEYLSRKSDLTVKSPFTASLYTGVAYITTVIVLIIPFLLIDNVFLALPVTLGLAVLVIVLFTFYSSIARDLPFWSRFIEMAMISLGIAGISFLIGMAIRIFLGVTV
jgi:VIT1/CCC1 family predicted Fe2+/Mn2+ transporter